MSGPLVRRLARLSAAERKAVIGALSPEQATEFNERWAGGFARGEQLAPPGDWRIWLIRAGRGFGKTRAGAEWVSEIARTNPAARIALVGETDEEVRRVMIEGTSGLTAVARTGERPTWRAGSRELIFASGARAFVYSASAPEGLRGPEHHFAWCDELAKWRRGEAAWDNLMMGLRLGRSPRACVTTTPRPTRLMRRVMASKGLVETHGTTRANAHLPPGFVAAMEDGYAGTRLGRQEIEGELIDDVAGALWTRALIEGRRLGDIGRAVPGFLPGYVRVVIGVDPPAGIGGDACGIVAVALGRDGHAYVIEDASVVGMRPEGWARAVAACAARTGADRVVAEANQGGEMVRSVLAAADTMLPVTLVHASRGKVARAEPVAALYERGKVWHAGAFPALEDELCGMVTGGGYEGPGRSPDRADALVWAVTELMLGVRRRVAITVM